MTSTQKSIARKRVSGASKKGARGHIVTTVASRTKAWAEETVKSHGRYHGGFDQGEYATNWSVFAEAVSRIKLLFQSHGYELYQVAELTSLSASEDKRSAALRAAIETAQTIGRELTADWRGDADTVLGDLLAEHIMLAYGEPGNNVVKDEGSIAQLSRIAITAGIDLDEELLSDLIEPSQRYTRVNSTLQSRFANATVAQKQALEAWDRAVDEWYDNATQIADKLHSGFSEKGKVPLEKIDEALYLHLYQELCAGIYLRKAARSSDRESEQNAIDKRTEIVQHLSAIGDLVGRQTVASLLQPYAKKNKSTVVTAVDRDGDGDVDDIFVRTGAKPHHQNEFDDDRTRFTGAKKQYHSEKNEKPGPVHGERDRSRGRTHQYHSEPNEKKGVTGSHDYKSRGRTHQYNSEPNEKPGPVHGQRDRSRGRTHQYNSEKNEKKGVTGSHDYKSRGSAKTIESAAEATTTESASRRSEANEKPGPVRGLRDWRGDRHSGGAKKKTTKSRGSAKTIDSDAQYVKRPRDDSSSSSSSEGKKKVKSRARFADDDTGSSSSSGNDEESGSESLSDIFDPRDQARRAARREGALATFKSVF